MSKDTSLSPSLENFLEFNGKRIATLRNDGIWWVAVKPICEALEVDYRRQHKNILSDEILSQLSSEQTIVAADNRKRKMVCLPEQYVYGWLFSLNSKSEGLRKYKKKCYDVLFKYFHGALTGRMKILEERIDINAQIKEKQAELEKSEIYQAIEELKKKRTQAGRELNKMDKDLASGQLKFIFN